VKHKNLTLITLAKDFAADGLPLHIQDVPANSPLIGAVRNAYQGLGMVLVRPARHDALVTVSAYPASMKGVSAMVSDVFREGLLAA
jgi:hypothetical protein